jgi:hypothetical protein
MVAGVRRVQSALLKPSEIDRAGVVNSNSTVPVAASTL